ncbi:MAG: hypothetical protein LBG13_02115 [Holosporales bacterium]|jgi:putrescine transport system substrate-binding protein|nr:hypothetical protein [Holosporales bacterium]
MFGVRKVFVSVLSCIVLFFAWQSVSKTNNVVNVYGWYGIIPISVIKDFENQTGIKVVYDFYDNNDSLEAKLLTSSNSVREQAICYECL